MSILPDLPGIPSYFAPLPEDRAWRLSLESLMSRALLALHREPDVSGSRIRSIEHITSDKKKHALALPTEVFKRCVLFMRREDPSTLDILGYFLLSLEEEKSKEQLLEVWTHLAPEDKTFLCYHLWQGMGRPEGDPDYGMHEIEKDPSILLRIKTADGRNLIEKLIDIRTQQNIIPELQKLIGESAEDIQISPHYNLLCWFAWWQDGGKDDPHFGEIDYGKIKLDGHPELLNEYIERLIEELNNKSALEEMPGLYYEAGPLVSYKTLDTQLLIDMAKEVLRGHRPHLYDDVLYFSMGGPEVMIEVAKTLALDPSGSFCFYIRTFGIKDETALVEIAKIAAANPESRLCSNIEAFGIKDKASLIEIAKIAAATPRSGLCEHIQEFGIEDKAALVEIAKIAAATIGSGLCEHIQNFGIKDKTVLIEIAKIAATSDEPNFCRRMKSFGITDEADLIEMASIAAANLHSSFFYEIQELGITSQEGLIKIAKIAAATPRSGLCYYIDKFGIKEKKAVADIAGIAARTPNSDFYCRIEKFRLDKKNREEVLAIATEHYLSTVAASIAASKRPDVKKTIQTILDIRDSKLRIKIFDLFMKNIVKGKFQEIYFTLADNAHKVIPMIYIAAWLKKASMPVDFVPAIQSMFSTFRLKFKDSETKLLAVSMDLLDTLDTERRLSAKDKLTLFNQVCSISTDFDALKRNLRLFLVLLKMGCFAEKGIEALPADFSQRDLIQAMNSQIAMPLFGKAELSPTEIDRYLLLCDSQRVPFALELYASRITDPDTKKTMIRFIGSVLDGSFKSLRYAAAASPHLSVLASMAVGGSSAAPKSLLDLWQDLSIQNTESPAAGGAGAAAPAAASAVDKGSGLPSFGDWLREKLITDSHLADADANLPALMGLLRSGKDVRAGAEEILTSAAKISDVEKACLEAIGTESKEELLISLKKLQELTEKNTDLKGSQWKRDIQELIKMMESKASAAFTAQITDDWQDLFLCGTEVLGSCQAIEGSPGLNKCLLGYCMDGKVQMAALKDPKSGKILARALLKLLIKEEVGADGAVRNVPVIFLERIYPANPVYTKALNDLAIARARHLGLELYTHNESIETGSEKALLQSLGTSGPYEYEDGGVGVSDGVYTIAEARKVVL